MIYWTPPKIWRGQDCYIIGGGPSLQMFDWELLRPRHTIGCNAAFKLGHEICEICVFGDYSFLGTFEDELKTWEGLVVTNLPVPFTRDRAWIRQMRRIPKGLATGDALAWNSNTGAVAINLALSLGVARVFLLGFDMTLRDGKSNWHTHSTCKNPNNAAVYPRFIRGFAKLKKALDADFPDRQVINLVGSEGSELGDFPRESLEEHFALEGATA